LGNNEKNFEILIWSVFQSFFDQITETLTRKGFQEFLSLLHHNSITDQEVCLMVKRTLQASLAKMQQVKQGFALKGWIDKEIK